MFMSVNAHPSEAKSIGEALIRAVKKDPLLLHRLPDDVVDVLADVGLPENEDGWRYWGQSW